MLNEQKEIKLIDGNKLIEQLESFKYLEMTKDNEEIVHKTEAVLETLDNCIEAITEQEIIFECDVDLIKEMKGRDIPNESNKFNRNKRN